jgi:hypothetical protein
MNTLCITNQAILATYYQHAKALPWQLLCFCIELCSTDSSAPLILNNIHREFYHFTVFTHSEKRKKSSYASFASLLLVNKAANLFQMARYITRQVTPASQLCDTHNIWANITQITLLQVHSNYKLFAHPTSHIHTSHRGSNLEIMLVFIKLWNYNARNQNK